MVEVWPSGPSRRMKTSFPAVSLRPPAMEMIWSRFFRPTSS